MTIWTYDGKMIDFVYNDGGRRKAGHRGSVYDCGLRAICIVTGIDYDTLYKEFDELGKKYIREHDDPNDAFTKFLIKKGTDPANGLNEPIYKPYIEEVMGWTWKPHDGSWSSKHKMAGPAEELPKEGTLLLNMRHHMGAFIDGTLYDTFDSAYERMIYGYWSK